MQELPLNEALSCPRWTIVLQKIFGMAVNKSPIEWESDMNEDEWKAMRALEISKDDSNDEGPESIAYFEQIQSKRHNILSALFSYVNHRFVSPTTTESKRYLALPVGSSLL